MPVIKKKATFDGILITLSNGRQKAAGRLPVLQFPPNLDDAPLATKNDIVLCINEGADQPLETIG